MPNIFRSLKYCHDWLNSKLPFSDLLVLISLIVGVITIFGGPERELKYAENPDKIIINSNKEYLPIRIFYNDELVDTSIVVASIGIWNAGDQPIRPSHIIEPLSINISNTRGIIGADTIRKSRSAVHLSILEDEFANGKIGVKWNILEEDDWAIIQFSFLGDEKSIIKVSSVVEGQRNIHSANYGINSWRVGDAF